LMEDEIVLTDQGQGMVQGPEGGFGKNHVVKRPPRFERLHQLPAGGNASEEEIANGISHGDGL
jgi:hypothetical protein